MGRLGTGTGTRTSMGTGYSKQEFACIPVAAIHINTSPVRVRVTCEFHSHEQFCKVHPLCFSCILWVTIK